MKVRLHFGYQHYFDFEPDDAAQLAELIESIRKGEMPDINFKKNNSRAIIRGTAVVAIEVTTP
jgi:hypothetical protein